MTIETIDKLIEEVQGTTKRVGSVHSDAFQGEFDDKDKLKRLIKFILKEKARILDLEKCP